MFYCKTYEETLNKIKEIALKNNTSIYHFGSRVWGKPEKDSDIDVMIDDENKSVLSNTMFDIEEILSRFKIDVSTSDYIDNDLYERILKDGIKL